LIGAPHRVVLHPLLFAAFPVLYLWAHNVQEGVTMADVIWPLVLCVAVTGILFAIGWQALGRNAARAGLALSILVLLFFSYGYVFRALEGVRIGGFRDEPETGFLIGRNTYLLPLWAGLAMLGVFLSLRARRRLSGWTQILNYAAAGLVVINVATVAWAEARGATRSGQLPQGPIPQRVLPPGTARPDIYYIVLEEYAGERALRRFFGYDNSPFLDFLERKGFYVATASTANYPRTSISLASSLNLGYLTQDPERVAGEARSRPLLENHAVGSYLKAIGYRYVHLGSWWSPTRTNPNADVNIKFGSVSEFSTVLYQTTAIYPIAQRLGLFAEKLDSRLREYRREKFQFAKLVETRSIPSPKFVFAHIMAPHSPYVFDANGGFLPGEAVRRGTIKKVYVDQLSFVNKQVMALVERLLSGPPASHPVILIQSDEGPYPGNPSRWSSRPSRTTLLRKFEILNAFYFPGATYGGLHPQITPVNEFRAVFREYFDPNLSLLPDRNFVFKDVKHLYQFTEVTGQVRESMGP
jgi:hypothetical protein